MITEQNAFENGNGSFTTEASMLRLHAGYAPSALLTTNLGNGQAFVYVRTNRHNGEIMSWFYQQAAGSITLEIFND